MVRRCISSKRFSHGSRLVLERLESRLAPSAGYLRIVSYNIASSVSPGHPDAGLSTLLQAMGAEPVPETDPPTGRAQPIDLIALQEVFTQGSTSQDVAVMMNKLYPSASYAHGKLDGETTGSGTQGVVFNANTLQLVDEAAIGVASTTGQPRQTMRYKFQPVGYPASTAFFVYNSHFKADSDSTSQNRRLTEANVIRADADSSTVGNSAVLYVGDFNSYSSSEAFYQKLLSSGQGHAIDPINTPGDWHNTGSFVRWFTQAPADSPPGGLTGGGLDDRFDFQLNTNELTDGVGIDFVSDTYHTFGNNGSVSVNGDINETSSKALPTLANRTTVLNLLTTVTDHLPVVADYQIMTPPTASLKINDGSAQRSMVTSLTITFSVNVTFPSGLPAAIQLQRSGPGAPAGNVNLGFTHTDNVVTITFNDSTYAPQVGTLKSLIDGKYSLNLVAAKIQGAGGKLDGNGDGTSGDNQSFSLHRLFGDANGDLLVSSVDFAAFRNVFGTSSLTFDVDGDGQVSASDFAAFRMRYGTML